MRIYKSYKQSQMGSNLIVIYSILFLTMRLQKILYLPLHLSPVGRSLGYKEGQLTLAESISGRLLILPFYYELKYEEQTEIINLIKNF